MPRLIPPPIQPPIAARGRRLIGLLGLATLCSCASFGYHRVRGPAISDTAKTGPHTHVILVVIEGLRRDVLQAYLDGLQEDDLQPDWPSGLAFLAREGFRLGRSTRAEAPVPAYGMASAATLATGQYPNRSGVPGSVWYSAAPDGSLLRFDFESAPDASRIYFLPEFEIPSPDGQGRDPTPLLSAQLRSPTMYERLAPTHRSVVVFHPFGAGAEWLIPSRAGAAVTAIMRHKRAAAVVPLFDRGTRDAAIELLLDEGPPDLLTLYFSGVGLTSCFQENAVCAGTVGGLEVLQRDGLRSIDAHLSKIFGKLAAARPQAFAGTQVVLVGTAGAVDRAVGEVPDREHVLTAKALGARLAEQAPDDDCAQWLRQAPTRGDLVMAANGAAAHLYLRRGYPGARPERPKRLRCLGAAIDATLARTDWLSGAAWIPPEADGAALDRSALAVVRLRPTFRRGLAAQRRARLEAKLRLAFDDGPETRSGDAILFASGAWFFADDPTRRSLPHASQGGLEDEAMEVAFLVASRELDETAATALEVTAVEMADVAPTVLSLLEAPAQAFDGLPRPPVLAWRDGGGRRSLELKRADRRIPPPDELSRPSLTWRYEPGAIGFEIGLDEPLRLTEPVRIELRLGGARYHWDDQAGFAEGAPCTYEEVRETGLRRWRCRLKSPQAGLQTLAAERTPSWRDEDNEASLDRFLQPAVFNTGVPSFDEAGPRVICATEGFVRARVGATDGLGLSRIGVVLVSATEAGEPLRNPGGAFAQRALDTLEAPAACESAVLADACAYRPRPQLEADATIDIPFLASILRHHRRSTRLLAESRLRRDRTLRATFEAAPPPGATQPPDDAYLALRVCNLGGRCIQRPLISDQDFADLIKLGCP